MLYDKRWEKPEIKADPFSLESLIAWLEKQPRGRIYCYFENGGCLFAKYFTAMGFRAVAVGGWDFVHEGGREQFSEAFGKLAVESPHTFGAALTRAREALAVA